MGEKKEKNKLEKMEIRWDAGFGGSGWKGIRWNSREWRFEGHDGTGNKFFYAPFNFSITEDEAIALVRDNIDLDSAIGLYCKIYYYRKEDEDTIADYINNLKFTSEEKEYCEEFD